MVDVADEFLRAARAFRAAFTAHDRDDASSARRVRNAVARVYLAAVFLPSHGVAEEPRPTSEVDPLAALDTALADAIRLLQADVPGAVWRVREDFELHWGGLALDVLRPLHRVATGA
jgi:hypothetical protein